MQQKKKQRSCVACGSKDAKQRLFRLVRDGQGRVSFDASGKQPGRGAYVCSWDCFEAARRTHRFERVLRTRMNEKDYDRVAEELVSQCADDRIR